MKLDWGCGSYLVKSLSSSHHLFLRYFREDCNDMNLSSPGGSPTIVSYNAVKIYLTLV
jgi:hypothetical protein